MVKTSEFAYKRVKYAITELLRQNKWRHNQAIPSEPILAARYLVSIGTIRRAINELVVENILVREQGRGTFVVSHTPDYMLNVFFRIESTEGVRELPNSKLLSFEKIRATPFIAEKLSIKPYEKIYKVKTLLSFRHQPAIVDEIYLSEKMFPNLSESFFSDRNETLYGLFQRVYGITVLNISETIEAIPSNKYISKLLKLKINLPILCVKRVAYAYKGKPVDMRIRYIHSSKYRYFNNLGGG
jgi:GntR family transcriptional regulator